MRALEPLLDEVRASRGWVLGQLIAHDLFADPDERILEAGQVNTVVTVVTVGVVALIGVVIFDDVNEAAFPDADTDTANNSALENTSSNVTEGLGDAMDLIPVVLLVMVASLVIAVVQQF